VATHVDAFKKYQRGEAWTWEHMALTRSRVVVAGDAELAAEIETEVQELLALPRDPKKIAAEAVEMRAMIEKEKPARDIWDIKLIPGGLIDLEFIAQVAVLCGRLNGERITGTAKTLARLSPDFADSQTKRDLTEAYALYLALTQMIRLCLTGPFEKEDSPPGLVDLLLAATDLPDIKVLEAHLKETAAKVRGHFNRLLGAGRKSS
jgi:glutamate-ammonia-ligase adenylyltransferase